MPFPDLKTEETKTDRIVRMMEKHNYGYSKRMVAYNFLAFHLGLEYENIPYDDGLKEDFITILPREELLVFNPKNPRPDNLLQRDDAVLNYFETELGVIIK